MGVCGGRSGRRGPAAFGSVGRRGRHSAHLEDFAAGEVLWQVEFPN